MPLQNHKTRVINRILHRWINWLKYAATVHKKSWNLQPHRCDFLHSGIKVVGTKWSDGRRKSTGYRLLMTTLIKPSWTFSHLNNCISICSPSMKLVYPGISHILITLPPVQGHTFSFFFAAFSRLPSVFATIRFFCWFFILLCLGKEGFHKGVNVW